MLGAGTEAINAGCEDNKAFFRRGKCYRHLGELDKANSFLSLSLLHAYLCLSESSCVRVLWVPNNAHLIALNTALIFDQSVPLTRMMHTTWLTRLVRSSTTWQRGIQTTRMSSANCWRWRSAKKSRMSRPKRPLPRCLPERGAVCAACVCACGPGFLHVRQGFLRPRSLSRGQNVALTSWKFLLQWSLTPGQKRTASTSDN